MKKKIQNKLKISITIAFGDAVKEADGLIHLEPEEQSYLPNSEYMTIQERV